MSTSPYISPVQDVVVRTVQESWHEANLERYLWPHLTQVQTLGLRTQHSGVTTYPLSALDNALLKASQGRVWRPGQAIPPARKQGESTITITLASEANDPVPRPIPRAGDRSRVADSRNQAALQLAILYSRRDQVIINLLVTNTIFGNGSGAQLSWSGTQKLDEIDTTGDQDPIGDIDTQADDIRYWANALGLKMIAILDRKTATVLSRKPEYHGAGRGAAGGGSGAGKAGKVLDIVSALKGAHGFEDVFITDLPADTVALGQTSSPDYIATTPFFWLGLVSSQNHVLKDDSTEGPDGAFAFASEFHPFVDQWDPDGMEVRMYMGKDAMQAFSIRGGTMGRCFTGNFT